MNNAMIDRFNERLQLHRALVQKNLLLMKGFLGLSHDILLQKAKEHDLSKFKEPERTTYIWMTWKYYCQSKNMEFEYPQNKKALIVEGWQHHILNNKHHPESHEDSNAMAIIDMVEMVCDWSAISQENNGYGASCMSWAKLNIDKKWQFSLEKKEFIFFIIRELDKRSKAFNEGYHE